MSTEVWFDCGVWDLIKEFAGIYNYSIKWGFKMTAHHYWVSNCVNCFDKITESAYKKLGEDVIRRMFWKDLNAGQYFNKYSRTAPLPRSNKIQCLETFEKQFNDFRPPADLKIGDTVRFRHTHDASYEGSYLYGRVCKINAKSFTVESFKPVLVDSIGRINGSDVTQYWRVNTAIITDKHIIKSNKFKKEPLEPHVNKNGIVYHYTRNIYYD